MNFTSVYFCVDIFVPSLALALAEAVNLTFCPCFALVLSGMLYYTNTPLILRLVSIQSFLVILWCKSQCFALQSFSDHTLCTNWGASAS